MPSAVNVMQAPPSLAASRTQHRVPGLAGDIRDAADATLPFAILPSYTGSASCATLPWCGAAMLQLTARPEISNILGCQRLGGPL